MKMKIRVANPAGNITVFVMDKVQREDYAKISAQILDRKELHAEQVGFIEQEGKAVHMQMMGGEFCGNATRSFAYLLSMLSDEKPEEVLVDVSGSDRPLKAEINPEKGTSRVEMPLPVDRKELRLGGESSLSGCGIRWYLPHYCRRSAGRAGIGGSSYSGSRENLSLRCIWRHVSAEGAHGSGSICKGNRFHGMGEQLRKRKYGGSCVSFRAGEGRKLCLQTAPAGRCD